MKNSNAIKHSAIVWEILTLGLCCRYGNICCEIRDRRVKSEELMGQYVGLVVVNWIMEIL